MGPLFSLKREEDLAICHNIDEPREQYAKCNKLDTEKNIAYLMWDL
jgi:hypothetical protein